MNYQLFRHFSCLLSTTLLLSIFMLCATPAFAAQVAGGDDLERVPVSDSAEYEPGPDANPDGSSYEPGPGANPDGLPYEDDESRTTKTPVPTKIFDSAKPVFSTIIIDEAGNLVADSRLTAGQTYTIRTTFYNASSLTATGTSISLTNINNRKSLPGKFEVNLMADNFSLRDSSGRTSNSATASVNLLPEDDRSETQIGYSYIPGSATFKAASDPVALSDVELFNRETGVIIGYTEMNGELVGGRNHLCELSFQIKTDGSDAPADPNAANSQENAGEGGDKAISSDEENTSDAVNSADTERNPTSSPATVTDRPFSWLTFTISMVGLGIVISVSFVAKELREIRMIQNTRLTVEEDMARSPRSLSLRATAASDHEEDEPDDE